MSFKRWMQEMRQGSTFKSSPRTTSEKSTSSEGAKMPVYCGWCGSKLVYKTKDSEIDSGLRLTIAMCMVRDAGKFHTWRIVDRKYVYPERDRYDEYTGEPLYVR